MSVGIATIRGGRDRSVWVLTPDLGQFTCRAAQRNEAMKLLACVAEDPTESAWHCPHTATCHVKPGKPRERGSQEHLRRHSRVQRKACDVVLDAIRIHERVLVRAGHRDPVILVGDAVPARYADERLVTAVVGYA